MTLMPRSGESPLHERPGSARAGRLGASAPNTGRDGFKGWFDNPNYGGNNDGTIDDGECAMGLVHAKLTEDIFELYDLNRNVALDRSEGNKLFSDFGITDSRVIDAIYGDVDLEYTSPSFLAETARLFLRRPRLQVPAPLRSGDSSRSAGSSSAQCPEDR